MISFGIDGHLNIHGNNRVFCESLRDVKFIVCFLTILVRLPYWIWNTEKQLLIQHTKPHHQS